MGREKQVGREKRRKWAERRSQLGRGREEVSVKRVERKKKEIFEVFHLCLKIIFRSTEKECQL